MAACESGKTSEALELLNRAVEAAPGRASCYNNRAQVLRLRGDRAAARADLDRALGLAAGDGKAAKQAYCQRGESRAAASPAVLVA